MMTPFVDLLKERSSRLAGHTSSSQTLLADALLPHDHGQTVWSCVVVDREEGAPHLQRLASRLPTGATALGVGASLDGADKPSWLRGGWWLLGL